MRSILKEMSVDCFHGLPANIASYSMLLTMIAEATDLIPFQLIMMLEDVHIYERHIPHVNEQLTRKPLVKPLIYVNNPENYKGIELFDRLEPEDIIIDDYECYDMIKAAMVV